MSLSRLLQAVLVSSLFIACSREDGAGEDSSSTEYATFHSLRAKGAYGIVLSQGPQRVEIEIDEDAADLLSVEVRDEVLAVSWKRKVAALTNIPKLHIQSPEWKGVRIDGASKVTTADTLVVDRFSIHVQGASHLSLALDGESVSSKIDGAGHIALSGRCVEQDISISGAGHYRAADLKTESTELNVYGTADVQVHAAELLSGDLQGASFLRYAGDPELTVKKSGIASIRPMN